MNETETVRATMGLTTPALVTSSRSTEKRKLNPSDFKFGKMIGEGSFSIVLLGLEIATNREFAIKVLRKKWNFGNLMMNVFFRKLGLWKKANIKGKEGEVYKTRKRYYVQVDRVEQSQTLLCAALLYISGKRLRW